MGEFVKRLDDVVELDTRTKPATVELRQDVDVAPGIALVERARLRGGWRIRPDLWDAVVDCNSGLTYVWDGNRATPLSGDEDLKRRDLPVFPTTTPEELTAWRKAFAEEAADSLGQPLRPELEAWLEESLPSERLPANLRNQWFGVLKRHVRARLDAWFAEHALEPPEDWISSKQARRARADDDPEHLRRVVVRAVEQMTRAELESLRLPAAVL